jgi:hypothetical protein
MSGSAFGQRPAGLQNPLSALKSRAESGEQLLTAIATQIKRLKSPQLRRETLDASRMLADLRYFDQLNAKQIKALCKASLKFKVKDELSAWFTKQTAAH